MITNFNTSNFGSGGGVGTTKKSNAIFWIIGLALVGYLGYRYIVKPEMDKQRK